MMMKQEGHVKYPPRSYQTYGEFGNESQINTQQDHRPCSEFNSSSITEQPHLISKGFPKELSDLARPSAHSSIIDDWTWESFSIGVGAGAIHIILADLNSQNTRLLMGFEVFFYFTDVISFMINAAILITQHIRGARMIKGSLENTQTSAMLSLMPINLATIVIGSFRYGLASGWLQSNGAICLFHCYLILLISILTPHWLMRFRRSHVLEKLPTSFYLIPIPLLLAGVMATHLLDVMSSESVTSLNVLLIGYFFGGLGMALAVTFLFLFIFRIILHGHGNGEQTVASILVAGYPAFCAQIMIGLGISSRIIFVESPSTNINETLGEVWYGTGIIVGIIFLGLSLALVFMTISNSWWKIAPDSRPPLALWMISITCCSWAISSACSPLCTIFDSTWLRAVRLIFMTSGVFTYLLILPVMIMRHFKKILTTRKSPPHNFPPTGFTFQTPDQHRRAELLDLSIDHRKFTPRCINLDHADRSVVSQPDRTRNSGLSQATLVIGQNIKPEPNVTKC